MQKTRQHCCCRRHHHNPRLLTLLRQLRSHRAQPLVRLTMALRKDAPSLERSDTDTTTNTNPTNTTMLLLHRLSMRGHPHQQQPVLVARWHPCQHTLTQHPPPALHRTVLAWMLAQPTNHQQGMRSSCLQSGHQKSDCPVKAPRMQHRRTEAPMAVYRTLQVLLSAQQQHVQQHRRIRGLNPATPPPLAKTTDRQSVESWLVCSKLQTLPRDWTIFRSHLMVLMLVLRLVLRLVQAVGMRLRVSPVNLMDGTKRQSRCGASGATNTRRQNAVGKKIARRSKLQKHAVQQNAKPTKSSRLKNRS